MCAVSVRVFVCGESACLCVMDSKPESELFKGVQDSWCPENRLMVLPGTETRGNSREAS